MKPKTWIVSIVGVALFLLVVIFGARACRLNEQIVGLKEKVNIQTVELKGAEDARKAAEANFITTVAEKDKDIAKWKEVADKNKAGMSAGDKKIAQLKEELAKLNPAEKDAIILKQKELISTLEGNLTLAYSTITAKDGIIGAWESKYKACDGFVTALTEENTKLRGLNDTLKALNKSLESRVGMSLFSGKVKTGLIVGAVGLAAYLLIKK